MPRMLSKFAQKILKNEKSIFEDYFTNLLLMITRNAFIIRFGGTFSQPIRVLMNNRYIFKLFGIMYMGMKGVRIGKENLMVIWKN